MICGRPSFLSSSPVVRGSALFFAPLQWQRRESVRVVDPLSETTNDNLFESGRLSRNAKANTR